MAVPSVLTDSYDALLSTTLRKYVDTKLHDNICRSNKVLAWLDSKGHWKTQDGGERGQLALMYQLNSTADIYSGYGTLDTTPQDGITSAFFDWSEIAVSVAISHKEERQNSGQSRMLSLLGSKTLQAEVSIKELVNNCIVGGRLAAGGTQASFTRRIGRLDSGAFGPLPLTALVDSNPTRTRTDIGNINPNTYAWWANQHALSTATTWAGVRREMNVQYNLCSRGSGGSPDLLLGDVTSWENYWAGLEGKEQYVMTAPRVVDILGASSALAFRGAAFIWDEVVPDTYNGGDVIDAVGSRTEGNIFFLNTDTLYFISDAQTDFVTTDFIKPVGQNAKVAEILWMGFLGVNNRRKNGLLDSIQWAITS